MNILLLDDDIDCLISLAAVLKDAGRRCDEFTVPEKAVEAYRQKQHDVVITDMKMPGMNGIQVLKKIRLLNPAARVIIVTGFGDVETAFAALNNGAYAFFGKPVDINDLMDTLEKIEGEINGQEKAKTDRARLALEYARLKQVYEELLGLLKNR